MPRKIKIPRKSGIREKVVYRDSFGRFASRDMSASEEHWKYRVGPKNQILDLKVEALPFREENTEWYRSLEVSQTGARAGKIGNAIRDTIKQIPVARHDIRLEISMSARTYHGKRVKRKISFYHYNSKKLEEHTVRGILQAMFYEQGDRPAYPTKIVKGWRKRHVTKKETERRRQLYDVRFNIKTVVENREDRARKKKIKK